jgi:hypothetical protein
MYSKLQITDNKAISRSCLGIWLEGLRKATKIVSSEEFMFLLNLGRFGSRFNAISLWIITRMAVECVEMEKLKVYSCVQCPRQRSHSWVRVAQDSWPYFTVSDSRLPQPGGPRPHIYIPQEQGGPVIPPGTVFSFRRLLRLARLRWRYSNPPPRGK